MQKTKIEWADSTWNPVTGCLNGCSYCYARKIAERFGGGGHSNGEYHMELLMMDFLCIAFTANNPLHSHFGLLLPCICIVLTNHNTTISLSVSLYAPWLTCSATGSLTNGSCRYSMLARKLRSTSICS